MSDQDILELIENEFKCKKLGTTEQYLEIHQPIYENGKLKIERIDTESIDNIIVAYIPVIEEYFFFSVYIDNETKEVLNVGTESRNIVSLIVTSEIFSSEKLRSFTSLKPTASWDKDELKPNRRTKYLNSGLEFLPNPEPDEAEDKLKKLLNFLHQDTQGVLSLSGNATATIQIVIDAHHDNQHICGAFINSENIKAMNNLNVELLIDLWAWGQPFK